MPIEAPWKGCSKTAMPTLSTLILANTIAILSLSVLNASALDISSHHPPAYVKTHSALIRVELCFFWCTIPTVLLISTTYDAFALWTNRLRPIWAVVSSTTAIGIWMAQLALWEMCIDPLSDGGAPGVCPYVYRGEGWGTYASWYMASRRAPSIAAGCVVVLYIAQLVFASLILNRQRKSHFRKSDLWTRPNTYVHSDMRKVTQIEAGSLLSQTSSYSSSPRLSELSAFVDEPRSYVDERDRRWSPETIGSMYSVPSAYSSNSQHAPEAVRVSEVSVHLPQIRVVSDASDCAELDIGRQDMVHEAQ